MSPSPAGGVYGDAARVLPGTGGQEVTIPRLGHFMLGIVVPVPASPTPGMMRALADGHRRITMRPEKTGETGLLDIVGSREESPVTSGAIGTGKQGVA